MTLMEMLKELRQMKKVRRRGWPDRLRYICRASDGDPSTIFACCTDGTERVYSPLFKDLEATDWITIAEEEYQ